MKVKQFFKYLIYKSWIFVLSVINLTGFYWVLRFLKRRNVLILAYHGVVHDKDQINLTKSVVSYDGKHISESSFKKQIEYLKKRYALMSLSDYIKSIKTDKRLPNNVCVLTFDDGYHNNYSVVFPILKEKNVPSTMFICVNPITEGQLAWPDSLEIMINKTLKKEINIDYKSKNVHYDLSDIRKKIEACIDIKKRLKGIDDFERKRILDILSTNLGVILKQRGESKAYSMLSWNEVSEMSDFMDIGSHTLNHPSLSRLQDEQLKDELIKSKNDITKKIKKVATSISYPNGIYNNKVKEFSKKAGYLAAVTTKRGYNTPLTDLFELKRIPISNFDSYPEFIFKLHFDYDSIRQLFSFSYIYTKRALMNKVKYMSPNMNNYNPKTD